MALNIDMRISEAIFRETKKSVLSDYEIRCNIFVMALNDATGDGDLFSPFYTSINSRLTTSQKH